MRPIVEITYYKNSKQTKKPFNVKARLKRLHDSLSVTSLSQVYLSKGWGGELQRQRTLVL